MGEPIYIRHTETESIMGDKIVLYYFTMVSNDPEKEKLPYGVGIDMYTKLPDERVVKERKTSEGIFSSGRDAEKFVDMLCKYTVTPSTLEDIVEDNVMV